jgi:hypothetical protein
MDSWSPVAAEVSMSYGYGGQYMSRGSAPASVHTVAILQYLGGALALAGGVLLAVLAVRTRSQPFHPSTDIISPEGASRLFWVGAVFFAISGLIAIWLGRKAQRGRNWARWILILLSVLTIVGTVFQSYQLNNSRYYSGVVLPILYLILLNTRAARSWFRYHTY